MRIDSEQVVVKNPIIRIYTIDREKISMYIVFSWENVVKYLIKRIRGSSKGFKASIIIGINKHNPKLTIPVQNKPKI